MYNKNFQNIYYNDNLKYYWSNNILMTQTPMQQPNIIPNKDSIPGYGYLSIYVVSKNGAVPIKGALVTIYHIHEDGREHVHFHLVTDENGRVPDMKLPVRFSEMNSITNFLYHYSTYSVRVTANNYFTENIIDFQIFPGIETDLSIEMQPVTASRVDKVPEETIVIPPRPME